MIHIDEIKIPINSTRTFTVINGGFSKDDQSVFCCSEIISSIDPSTFEPISRNYGRDSSSIYYCDDNTDMLHRDSLVVVLRQNG